MSQHEELINAAGFVGNKLIGEGWDSLKPMSAKNCKILGDFLWDVIEGMTADEALQKAIAKQEEALNGQVQDNP